ncbi:MAG: YaaL family protein [Oscillospiraceae bacterium]|nr:YaaL family protein [Oscillospiraceae bacterium]
MLVKESEKYPGQPMRQAIREVQRQMARVNALFQQTEDPDLTECFIYERMALQARYRYLLKQLPRKSEQPALVPDLAKPQTVD